MVYLASTQKKVEEHSRCWDTPLGVSNLTVHRDCNKYQEAFDLGKRDGDGVEIRERAEEVGVGAELDTLAELLATFLRSERQPLIQDG